MLWVLFGALAVVAGPVLLFSGLRTVVAHVDVTTAPVCDGDFGRGCLTTRITRVVDDHPTGRYGWLTGERTVVVGSTQPLPGRPNGGRASVTVPRQHGRRHLPWSTPVSVVYYGTKPVELVTDVTLRTEDDPAYDGPTALSLGRFSLFGGLAGVDIGRRSARQGGWLRAEGAARATSRFSRWSMALAFTGVALLLGVQWFGPDDPLALAPTLVLAALVSWTVRKARARQGQGPAGAAEPAVG